MCELQDGFLHTPGALIQYFIASIVIPAGRAEK